MTKAERCRTCESTAALVALPEHERDGAVPHLCLACIRRGVALAAELGRASRKRSTGRGAQRILRARDAGGPALARKVAREVIHPHCLPVATPAAVPA